MAGTELMSLVAPLDSPLPPPPEGEVLTAAQWRTLMAIADTIIPCVEASTTSSHNKLSILASEYANAIQRIKKNIPAASDEQAAERFLQESASSTPGFKESVHRQLGHYVREDAVKGIRVILSALDTRAGCLLTTGSTTSFHLQPLNIRQQILINWGSSYLSFLRQSAKAFESLVIATWTKQSTTLSPILGFPRVPIHGKPGQGFDYTFLQFPPSEEAEIIQTDVVIIGSGCGGGVCAKNLAEAGQRVVVVEKAYYYAPQHLPMNHGDASIHLFANGGIDVSDDSSTAVVAGSAWGGGGTVNWSASLQTQNFVRQEWANAGMPFFTSSAFQDSLDRVCHRMGVSTNHVEHNDNNKFLLEGARKLGYSSTTVPQNTGGDRHYCGYCTLGCGSAEKQGPVVSFLPDAGNAGAQFIEGFEAEKIIFETINGKRFAVGVKGFWRSRDSSGSVSGSDRTSRSVIIKAKRVIVSAGSLQSPLLLLRSGLQNPQIGCNLYLHPVSLLGAVYPDRLNSWEGGILTSLVSDLQDLDGAGHGVRLEAMTMLPSFFLPFQPWNSALSYKLFCSAFSHTTGHVSLVRDINAGRVYPDPVDGRCRFSYTPGTFERKAALEGVITLAKIAYVSGATEIYGAVKGWPTFIRSQEPSTLDLGINDPEFQDFLLTIRAKGLTVPEATFGSAHQMGTCRMSSSEKGKNKREPAGVVDPSGKVWGVEGLYVADASVFPSASGVNPMVTTMAISDYISRGIARDMSVNSGRVEARL